MSTDLAEVELPVCEQCGHVGRMPNGNYGGATWCTGPGKQHHKRIRKTMRRFVEAPDPKDKAA